MIKRVLVCGAGGFIGSHLVNKLVEEGFYVRGVDLKEPEWSQSKAQEFVLADLREPDQAATALSGGFDHVYQLAADMGGMGFIHSAETEIMRNSMLINLNVIDQAARNGVEKYFLASSVCVYRDMKIGEGELSEIDAYPANPDNEYGWENLYAERTVLAYGREFGISTRIARFQNCYGPEGTWSGGREKAPAALCRKVAESTNGQIEAWGDGTAVRSFIFVDDLVTGIRKLMESDIEEPTNIGTREYVSVHELVQIVANVADKRIEPQWINGPVGVQSRNFSNDVIESTGFKPIYSLAAGLAVTYPWIEEQLLASNS